MSVQALQQNATAQLVVRLVDGSGDAVVSVAFGDVTTQYKKQGDAGWTSKSVLITDWEEISDGRYLLLFSAAELDTEGKFLYQVTASGAQTFTGDVDVVEDWATTVNMLTALLNGLSTKVSTDSIVASKKLQDEAIAAADDRVDVVNDQLVIMERKYQSLLNKLNS